MQIGFTFCPKKFPAAIFGVLPMRPQACRPSDWRQVRPELRLTSLSVLKATEGENSSSV
jgi:hypothetical protein